jgi:hypothetical protein
MPSNHITLRGLIPPCGSESPSFETEHTYVQYVDKTLEDHNAPTDCRMPGRARCLVLQRNH